MLAIMSCTVMYIQPCANLLATPLVPGGKRDAKVV